MGFKGKSISTASYDAGNRLTAWNRAGADENRSQTWDYDDAGNWNSTTKDGDTEGRTHSISNQITQLDGKAVSHDLKGNLTEYEYDRTDYRVKYDLDNRIVEVKADSETIRYRYDALGRRIVSKGDDETILIWWGDSECAEYEHRASKDAIQNDIMGHPTRLNSVIARDTEDRENRVELQWYHKNYLDHVYAVSNDNGNIQEHYRYTAFGEAEIYNTQGQKLAESAIDNDVLWNSRRFDGETGLYYYKYRHYKADIGRWLGRDPIEERGGINLYAFVGNDPIGRFDKYGLAILVNTDGSLNVTSDSGEADDQDCCEDEKYTDKFGARCCGGSLSIIKLKISESGSYGGRGGHISLYHPNVGTVGNWPTEGGLIDMFIDNPGLGFGFEKPDKKYNRVITLFTCPISANKIEKSIRHLFVNQPGFGIGPSVNPNRDPNDIFDLKPDKLPNCAECVADILNEAGSNVPDEVWTPDGVGDYFE